MNDQRRQMQNAYARQKAAIDAEVGEFVAPFEIMRLPDGREFSYTPWTEGAETLLPQAELVGLTGLVGGRRWFMLVPWDRVASITPTPWKVKPTLSPPRYETLRFPSGEELRLLAQWRLVGEPPAS